MNKKHLIYIFSEIKKLFGIDPNFKWQCAGLVLFQIVSLHFLQDKSWPFLIVFGYCVTGIINSALTLAIHEVVHNMAFGYGR